MTTALPEKKTQIVNGRRIAYVDEGSGAPIVLLHGNPTSSFLWRDVIPALTGLGRIIVPDLIGQGDSEMLPASDGPDRYSFQMAYDFFDGLLAALAVDRNVTLVLHDWGTALGFHWAHQHPDQVRAIAYMEGITMPIPSWEDWPEGARGIFQGFRSPKGEDLILNRNMFIEAVLPSAVLRKLSEEEMEVYRAPFRDRENRQVTLNWPRQIPIAGEPPHMVALVQAYADWLSQTTIPKLFINAEPGSILIGKQREFCRSWPNQTEVTVAGSHFIQEDSGPEIGKAVASFLSTPS